MRYLCMVYFDEAEQPTWPGYSVEQCIEESTAYTEALEASGHYVAASPLQPVSTATTLRVRNGKLSTTDGPFAETKEQLGGFLLIDARDLNEALRIAAGMPMARFGSIEVRPVLG